MLVTGGAGGIGGAVADWFVQHGSSVVVADLPARLDAVRATGRSTVEIDVCDEGSVVRAFGRVTEQVGAPTVVVNAAGITGVGSVEDMSLADWDRVLSVNLTGSFLVGREAVRSMRPRGRGKLVFLSSVNARTGGNELSGASYAAAKAGIQGLTRHLAKQYAPQVQVNAVAPGPVLTDMLARLSPAQVADLEKVVPAGRSARADEIAATIGFLCSPAADYITGVTIDQNGGMWMG